MEPAKRHGEKTCTRRRATTIMSVIMHVRVRNYIIKLNNIASRAENEALSHRARVIRRASRIYYGHGINFPCNTHKKIILVISFINQVLYFKIAYYILQ